MEKPLRRAPPTALPDFQDYLRKHLLAPEKSIPYLALWVDRYLDFLDRHPGLSVQDQRREYLNELSEKAKDWQLRQAAAAVHLYTSHFLRAQAVPASSRDMGWDTAFRALRDVLRLRRYSRKTEKSYSGWIRRFRRYVFLLNKTRPGECGREEVRNYLSRLAVVEKVSASSQNQAFNALIFFFRETLGIGLSDLGATVRARREERVPVVLTVDEVKALFSKADGMASLLLRLIYGTGLRVSEAVRLRVKDLDFDSGTLTVHAGKGGKDRTTVLPKKLKPVLQDYMAELKTEHQRELALGRGESPLPEALGRKYPGAGKEWGWQFLFPSADVSSSADGGRPLRWHMSEKTVQAMARRSARRAGLTKHATVHTLRHSFATHLLMNGVNIREIQDLLGHKHVETTMIYTHVLRNMAGAAESPLDAMEEEPARAGPHP